METKRKLNNMFVTLGTDLEGKFAWCIRKVDGVKCVVIHEAKEGNTFFNEKDYITAIPVSRILDNNKKIYYGKENSSSSI